MKTALFAVLLLSVADCFADCSSDAVVAVKFMNQYLAYTQSVMAKRSQQSAQSWLKSNILVSPDFLEAYKAKELEGLKLDAELGWDADMIFDAQDFPDKGFQFFRCSKTAGFVQLQGTDWPDFKVTVRVATTPQGINVVGAGMVNISKSERSVR
ncbi:MAG: hypothetical protein QM808_11570 [Steroidobacteraceae bacterium]